MPFVRSRHTMFVGVVALSLLGAACSSDGDDVADGAAEESTEETAAPSGPVLELASSEFGDILVDERGFVLYLFVPDAQGDSTCYDQCEVNWPVVTELAGVGDGLDAALLGTTTRTDGSVQATYNDWPLYYFINDGAAGDTAGQGVNDVWYVMDAAGDAIGQS